MSWYVSLVGKPSSIAKSLDEEAQNLQGQSGVEFRAALPHLQALVKENFHAEQAEPMVFLQANGSGYTRDGEQITRTLSVKIEPFNTKLV